MATFHRGKRSEFIKKEMINKDGAWNTTKYKLISRSKQSFIKNLEVAYVIIDYKRYQVTIKHSSSRGNIPQ